MPRIARLVVKGEPAVYHVISRTALDGYVLGDVEKDYLMALIKRLNSIYFSVYYLPRGKRMRYGKAIEDRIQRRFLSHNCQGE